MVKVKDNTSYLPDGSIDVDHWLQQLGQKGYFQDLDLIRHACSLGQLAGQDCGTETGQSCLQVGIAMADLLADLQVDRETLITAIVFESVHHAEWSIDDVQEQFGSTIAKLVQGVQKMAVTSTWQALDKYPQNKQQIDNVRKMLIAMVDDVRVVLIRLAERLCVLRTAAELPESMRKQLATEGMEIYAPLANRLGIGAIKWEIEDLAFRYLHVQEYKKIAKGLKAKRLDRDRYVAMIVDILNQRLATLRMTHFAVYGRSKHIHSIYRKMIRKNVLLDEIYDATAVRILVDTKEACYETLGRVHSMWQQVVHEFDDYIMHPKPNGYQSLHTAVIGPEDRVFEVQIRTFQMHEQAEMGVAAHWKYKEVGVVPKESHERKIAWLREVISWHREMAVNRGVSEVIESEFLEDRVYIFTPDGDVLDLPQGVTPLDFAYQVHTELGHRCRGAKINGSIVPLTYQLKTGDRVEILSGKELRPSRDWLNPHLNYLTTSRSKAKVLHWFKMQDYDKNKAEGAELIEKELKTLGVKTDQLQEVAEHLHFKCVGDLQAALGRGDVKVSQLLHRLTPHIELKKEIHTPIRAYKAEKPIGDDLRIEGLSHLLTHFARCCQPLPGDKVLGYVTIGRGVSIHKHDCSNILNATERQRQRFLQVNWGRDPKAHYAVGIQVKAFDRNGILRDVTAAIANEKIQLYDLNTQIHSKDNMTIIEFTIEIDGLNSLSHILAKLSLIPNVIEARRKI